MDVIQFPTKPIKTDAWAPIEEILRAHLKGALVLYAQPQEILTSTMDRMRKIFERCSDCLDIRAPLSVAVPLDFSLTAEQLECLKTLIQSALTNYHSEFVGMMLASISPEIAGMEMDLHSLSRAKEHGTSA